MSVLPIPAFHHCELLHIIMCTYYVVECRNGCPPSQFLFFHPYIYVVAHTVPITSNLTHLCESLTSDSQLSRKEGHVVSRVRVHVLTRKGCWSRETTIPAQRAHEYVLARPPALPREHTNTYSRDHQSS